MVLLSWLVQEIWCLASVLSAASSCWTPQEVGNSSDTYRRHEK